MKTRRRAIIVVFGAALALSMIAGLSLRRRPDTKYQDPSQQVRIKKGPDRIQVVSIPAEKRMETE